MAKRRPKAPPKPPGIFIVFEGGEGCGKTTQIKLLYEAMKKSGYPVILTKEPGGTSLGSSLREILINKNSVIDSHAELLLYMADRSQHVAEVIAPGLRDGKIILSDRHTLSTYAYQGYGKKLPLALISRLNRIACAPILPDLTFWLDISPAVGLRRARARASLDRMESQSLVFHQDVYEGFSKAAEKNSAIVTINANRSQEAVYQDVVNTIRVRFDIKV